MDINDKKDFGDRHKNWRKKGLGMTQEELRDYLKKEHNITKGQSSFSNYDRGQQFPPPEILQIYFTKGLNLNWLFTGNEEMRRSTQEENNKSETPEKVLEIFESFDDLADLDKMFFEIERLSMLSDKILGLSLTNSELKKCRSMIKERVKKTVKKIERP